MSARPNPYHYAWSESFLATLKAEMLQDGSFLNLADARSEIFAFIEAYYNPHRTHSALGYLSPGRCESTSSPLL